MIIPKSMVLCGTAMIPLLISDLLNCSLTFQASKLEVDELIRGKYAEEVRQECDDADEGKKLGRRARGDGQVTRLFDQQNHNQQQAKPHFGGV